MILKLHMVRAVVKIHVHAKFQLAECSQRLMSYRGHRRKN